MPKLSSEYTNKQASDKPNRINESDAQTREKRENQKMGSETKMKIELTDSERWLLKGCLNTVQLFGENNLKKLHIKKELDTTDKRAEQKLIYELTQIEKLKSKL